MTKTEEIAIEREIETMHAEYLERRSERDNQASISLGNLATWTMFRIVDGVK